jgi:hypothetical protein
MMQMEQHWKTSQQLAYELQVMSSPVLLEGGTLRMAL